MIEIKNRKKRERKLIIKNKNDILLILKNNLISQII